MYTYKIFLGSSIDEFKTEREKIKFSINDMNQTFNKDYLLCCLVRK